MATIYSTLEKVKNLDLEKVAMDSFEENKNLYADLNADQMYHGLRSDGSQITPHYSERTIELKKEKGQPYDRVTLRDTGSFYGGITVEVEDNKVITYSTDIKNDKLFSKYSTNTKNIFGLSPLYRREFRDEGYRQSWRLNIKKATGL